MQQPLINHNADLQRLHDEGYDLEICGGQYLIVHHIPYVTPSRVVAYGTLVCIISLAGTTRISPPGVHTIYFKGETPSDAGGVPLTAIINNSQLQQLTDKITVNHYFSSKPASGNYANYYEKIRTYSEILASQARVIDPAVTTRPHRQKIPQ